MDLKLTARELAEVTGRLQPPASARGAAELRRTSRLQVWGQVVIWPREGEAAAQPFTAICRDISLEGIGLITSRPLPPDSRFTVGLLRPRGESLCVACVSRYCREAAQGVFTIGATFIERRSMQPPQATGTNKPAG